MMRYIEAQYKMSEMRVMYWHAQIVSGAYKFRDLKRFEKSEDGTSVMRSATDEEKLQDTLDIMNNHLRFMQECLDSWGEK